VFKEVAPALESLIDRSLGIARTAHRPQMGGDLGRWCHEAAVAVVAAGSDADDDLSWSVAGALAEQSPARFN